MPLAKEIQSWPATIQLSFSPVIVWKFAKAVRKPGKGLSYPAMTVTASDPGVIGGWDVYDGIDQNGKEVSFYGFSVKIAISD